MQQTLSPFSWIENLSLKRALQILTAIFILVISGLVSYTVISLKQQNNDSLVINIAGRERMLSEKLTKEYFLELETARANGKTPSLDAMIKTEQLFEISLDALDRGGNTYLDLAMQQPAVLPPASAEVSAQLQQVKALWQTQKTLLASIANSSYSTADLFEINKHSADVLKNMNKAVMMFTAEADHRIAVMERNQFIAAACAILIVILFTSMIARSILRSINSTIETARRISSGDLKQYGATNYATNEMGTLSRSVEQMRVSLHDIINVVQQNSRQMAHSANQVTAVSTEISSSSKLQQDNSTEVISAINDLLDTSMVVSENIGKTAQISQDTLATAKEGIVYVNHNIQELGKAVASVNKTAEQMEALKEFTLQINEITESIHTIAEQTNLLALNAAIEAARAGEQGRGFAVVADEVRNLAGRTSSSSKEISDLIAQLMDKVESSVDSMNTVVSAVHQSQQTSEKTVEAFTSMSDGIDKTTESTETIHRFNHQQTEKLTYLNEKLDVLFSVLKESTDKATTTSMVANDLYQISEQLDKQLSGFDTHQSDSISKSETDKRRTPRAENKLRASIFQGHITTDGLTSDLSMEGLKIRSTSKLNRNDKLKIQFHLPAQLEKSNFRNMTLDATIIHMADAEDYYNYGLRFVNLTGYEQQFLKALFTHFHVPYQYQ